MLVTMIIKEETINLRIGGIGMFYGREVEGEVI